LIYTYEIKRVLRVIEQYAFLSKFIHCWLCDWF